MRLNLGSGSAPLVGSLNVDRVALPEVDFVHDLDVLPWPWGDGIAEEIVAQDVFEHVADPVGFMTESHRVLKFGAPLLMKVPHFRSVDAFTDPTHRRFCTPHTWDYWIRGTVLYERHNAAYGGVVFEMALREIVADTIFIQLNKI